MKNLTGLLAADWDATANYIIIAKDFEEDANIYRRIYSYYELWYAGQGKIHASGAKIFKMTVWPQRKFPPNKILIFAGEFQIGDKVGEIGKPGKRKYEIKRLGEPFINPTFPDSMFQYAYFR